MMSIGDKFRAMTSIQTISTEHPFTDGSTSPLIISVIFFWISRHRSSRCQKTGEFDTFPAMQSAYQLRNTLPNRSTSQRPRSLSLSEYQPLSFDRESLEAAYQHTIGLPSTSSASSRSIPSWSSFGVSGTGSADTHDTGITTPSLLPHELKRGDNPHGLIGNGPPPPLSSSNIAGVGAGHSLTPQQSPFHSAAKTHHASPLSPVPGSPVPIPPTPPARPSAIPDSTYALASEPHTGIGMRRVASAMDIDDGYSTDPGVSSRARGKRRALPALPTDVPAPVSYVCDAYRALTACRNRLNGSTSTYIPYSWNVNIFLLILLLADRTSNLTSRRSSLSHP